LKCFAFEKIVFDNDSSFISRKDNFSANIYDLIKGITIEIEDDTFTLNDIDFDVDTIYVLDAYNKKIYSIQKNKDKKKVFSLPSNVSPRSIKAVNGFIYVVIDNRIDIFDHSGNLINHIGDKRGNGDNELFSPSFLTVDNDGYIYVCDSGNERIQIFDPSRKFIYSINRKDGDFINPFGIDWSLNGNIAVTDNYRDMIIIFDNHASFVRSFGESGTSIGKFQYPTKIKFDPQGNIYVMDRYNFRIQKFDQMSKILSSIGNNNKRIMMNSPSFTIDNDGNLLLLDNKLGKIWIFGTRYFERGKESYIKNDYDSAIRLFRLSLSQRKENQNAAFYMAYCFFMKKMYKMAYNSLRKAYAIDSNTKCGKYAFQEINELEKWYAVGRNDE